MPAKARLLSVFRGLERWGQQRLKNCEFFMMPTSGHSAREPEIQSKLVEACNKYRDL